MMTSLFSSLTGLVIDTRYAPFSLAVGAVIQDGMLFCRSIQIAAKTMESNVPCGKPSKRGGYQSYSRISRQGIDSCFA